MGISDMIAEFIGELLEDDGGQTELQRSEVANRFGCVPSQINYVISTRFSPERGYIVESRRGGNGYIRIRRVQADPRTLVMHTINAIGDTLDLGTAQAFLANLTDHGAMDQQTETLMAAAIGESALRPVARGDRDKVRASITKHLLINLL